MLPCWWPKVKMTVNLAGDEMDKAETDRRIEEVLKANQLLQEELEQSNRGLIALTMELEQKNEELEIMNQQLLQAAKMATVGELVASVAHEFNNPLAVIGVRMDHLLQQVPAEDPKYRLLNIIDQEIERMSTLVSNLLSFSRRTSRQLSRVNIEQEIDSTLDLIFYHLRKNKITVNKQVTAREPFVMADNQQLRQLFLNLFTNASDAMPEGGQLLIKICEAGKKNENIRIEIQDSGCGIAEADLSRVMDPFFTTKVEGKGTGLGLSICRRIVYEHHGSIHILSELNRGTTISISLPRAE